MAGDGMMRVLVACEFSGVVRDAFLARGHDAVSCDLLPTESPGPHYQGDVVDILDREWDLMIAHPDCTYLTNACAWAFGDGPYHQKVKPETLVGAARREAREHALQFVEILWSAPIERVAIENPVGCINTKMPFMPRPQWIQPWQYGHDASKTTGLWKRNLPDLNPTEIIDPRWTCCGIPLDVELVGRYGCANCYGNNKPLPRWGNQTNSGQSNVAPSKNRWKDRAKTYQGIAEAMGGQWGSSI